MNTEPRTIYMQHCDVYVHPGEYRNPQTGKVEHEYGYVETRFRDGYVSPAARVPNDTTKRDAMDLGYANTADGVWRSLVEHELLHSIVSELFWNQPSRVLRHEAGAEYAPYYRRIFEESIVLGGQRLMQTGDLTDVLRATANHSNALVGRMLVAMRAASAKALR